MAHKKGVGSSRNGRDSNSQRRGIKVYGGERVRAGAVIVRQVGSTFHAGKGAAEGELAATGERVGVGELATGVGAGEGAGWLRFFAPRTMPTVSSPQASRVVCRVRRSHCSSTRPLISAPIASANGTVNPT